MRVVVHFLDGEVVEAESEAVNPNRMVFPVRPLSGNNRLAWVSMAGIKYVTHPEAAVEAPEGDPRAAEGHDKVILRFLDGEIVRAYHDDTFSHEGHGFNVRLYDEHTGKLLRAVISLHALKAIFFVETWDSRMDAGPGAGGEEMQPLRKDTRPLPVAPAGGPVALANFPQPLGLPGGSFPGRYLR
jgi:hypothetical protein